MKTYLLLLCALLFVLPSHSQTMEDVMKALQGQGVSIEENTDPFVPLKFTGSYRMEVHSYKKGVEEKDSPMNIGMAFSPAKMAMTPETGKSKGSMRMVFDLENKDTYTLITDDKGQRTGLKMKMMKVHSDKLEETTEHGDVVRTDEMKMIDGHKCRKYTYSSADGNSESWLAEDVEFNSMNAFSNMLGDKRMEQWQQVPYNGMLMETTWNKADGSEKVVMYTKELVVGEVSDSAFSHDGFEIQDLSNLPGMGR